MSQRTDDYRGPIPIWNRLSYPQRDRVLQAGFYGSLFAILFIFVFPLFWMFTSSIRERGSLVRDSPPLFSAQVTVQNYIDVLAQTNVTTWLTNSIIVAAGVIFLTVTIATLGGYGLTRLDIPRKKLFARGVLLGYMFPSILLAIPMFIYWRELGILNSRIGLIIAETALALPFSLWLMWKFFQTVPYSLEESAHMNGASQFRAFVDVALPLAKPGIIAISVWSFAVSWNEYTMAKILMTDRSMFVMTIGLETFFNRPGGILWGQLMAASFLACIPAFLFVYFLQKYLLRGFRAGGVG